jgi:IPT/TIG domain
MSTKFLFPKIQLWPVALTLLLVATCVAAKGGGGGGAAGLTVASPTVPPGGLLQMQVFITEPKPILKGKQGVNSRNANANVVAPALASPLGPVRDAALFSPAGDVSGVAVTASGATQFFFSSPLNNYGESIDTPVITLAYPVKATAHTGQTMGLNLDSTESLWLDPKSKPYVFELTSGVMTVGGSLSISDVIPGAGSPPPGTVISIIGVGFESNSKVDFGEAHVATTRFINPNLIEVTLGDDPIEIRGQRIRVENDNKEIATYFPYQRTKRVKKSNHLLVAESLPLFSQTAQTIGYFRPTLHGTLFTGLALQNLNIAKATATLLLYSKAGALLSTQKVVLATNTYMTRDLVELFPGVKPADGTKLTVTSDIAIEMLGLLGDDSSATLLPVAPSPTP